MDIRLLLYCGRLLEKYINERYKRGLHTTEKIEIPRAEFYVLFNASAKMTESEEFKTKIKLREGEFDIGTRIINIHYEELAEAIKERKDALGAYAFLIDKYEELKDNKLKNVEYVPTTEERDYICQKAFEEAIGLCRKEGLYLKIFDEEVFRTDTMRRMSYEEGLELYHDIGVEVGLKEGKKEIILKMLHSGLSKELISSSTNISLDELENLLGE